MGLHAGWDRNDFGRGHDAHGAQGEEGARDLKEDSDLVFLKKNLYQLENWSCEEKKIVVGETVNGSPGVARQEDAVVSSGRSQRRD